ncbi:MAG TPA: OB-fold domain-containing protein [Burkholderiaceae bacterium]|nr:OB-fold domain-containing protein [Burkholderiaceae bacterium]
MRASYLPPGLPPPAPDPDDLSRPFWDGLRDERLLVQRCSRCATWQFGPEWICHHCLAFDPDWIEVAPRGRLFSWERVWHPVHPALKNHGPYLVVLVELAEAGGVRLLGNLLGDPLQAPVIGAPMTGVFEHHADTDGEPFSLLHWRVAD